MHAKFIVFPLAGRVKLAVMLDQRLLAVIVQTFHVIVVFNSQVKEAMQRIHDRGNIGKLILDVEKAPTPLVI